MQRLKQPPTCHRCKKKIAHAAARRYWFGQVTCASCLRDAQAGKDKPS